MKQRTNEEIARAARDGPGIEAAMKRAVAKELDMRRKLGLPIVTAESLEADKAARPPHSDRSGNRD